MDTLTPIFSINAYTGADDTLIIHLILPETGPETRGPKPVTFFINDELVLGDSEFESPAATTPPPEHRPLKVVSNEPEPFSDSTLGNSAGVLKRYLTIRGSTGIIHAFTEHENHRAAIDNPDTDEWVWHEAHNKKQAIRQHDAQHQKWSEQISSYNMDNKMLYALKLPRNNKRKLTCLSGWDAFTS